MRRIRLCAGALALAALAAVPSPASAQLAPGVADCNVLAQPAPRAFAVALDGRSRATVLDRYGGAFQRNRLFVRWTVRISGFTADVPVRAAEFVVDTRVMHTDSTVSQRDGMATLLWAVSSRRFAAGEHVLRIRLLPRDGEGETREIEIPFQATECPFATFSGAALRRPRPLVVLTWASAAEGPGPELGSVVATLRAGPRLVAPQVRPGATVGWLDAGRRYNLRAPRSGSTLLAEGGLRVRLDVARQRVTVTGLPAGVTSVTVRLRAGILRVGAGCSRAWFEGELRGSRGDVARVEARDARRC
jgi:hypothetical protein